MDEREKSGETWEKRHQERWVMEGEGIIQFHEGRCEDEGEEERDGEMGKPLWWIEWHGIVKEIEVLSDE